MKQQATARLGTAFHGWTSQQWHRRWLPNSCAAVLLAIVSVVMLSGCDRPEPTPDDPPPIHTPKAIEQPTPGDQSNPFPAASPATRWPLFRGDPAGTGVATSELPEQLELLWKFTPPGRHSFTTTAAIADGMVFVGDAFEKFYALDLETGEEVWSVAAELGFVAPPAVDDGRVFVGDGDGVFRCFDAESGDSLWSQEAGGDINAGANFFDNTVLFAAQDGNLTRLNQQDGEVVWQFNIEAEGGIQCMPTRAGANVFFAGCDGLLHVLDITNGRRVASVSISDPSLSSPAILGDRAYFGTEGGNVFAIDWTKPEIVWTYRSEKGNQAYRSSAAVDLSVIVVAGRDKMVRALDPASGDQRWQFATRARVDSSPVIVGERVFVGSSDGRLYGLDKKSGEKIWEYDAGGEFTASCAVADGRLVIGNEDGTLYCFGAKRSE